MNKINAGSLLTLIERRREITINASLPFLADQGKTILWFTYTLDAKSVEGKVFGKPNKVFAILDDNTGKQIVADLAVELPRTECGEPELNQTAYTEKMLELTADYTEAEEEELLKKGIFEPFLPMYEAVKNLWEHRNDPEQEPAPEPDEEKAEENPVETVEEAAVEMPVEPETEPVQEAEVSHDGVNPAVLAAVFGAAVGDALGVPVEFKARETLDLDPVKGMREYGSHNQPMGTWSDDTSLMIALMDGLVKDDTSLQAAADNYIAWEEKAAFTAGGSVFDIGGTTNIAIGNMKNGIAPELCGETAETANGNGSLMRILPMAFVLMKEASMEVRQQEVFKVSSMTHAHLISKIACHIYVEMAIQILKGKNIDDAYEFVMDEVYSFYQNSDVPKEILDKFDRIFTGKMYSVKREEVESGGYVLHTLEATLWSLTHWISYEKAVLQAVNLGKDTDTTAMVAGGLAGILYGFDSIPKEWVSALQNKELLVEISKAFSEKYLCE